MGRGSAAPGGSQHARPAPEWPAITSLQLRPPDLSTGRVRLASARSRRLPLPRAFR